MFGIDQFFRNIAEGRLHHHGNSIADILAWMRLLKVMGRLFSLSSRPERRSRQSENICVPSCRTCLIHTALFCSPGYQKCSCWTMSSMQNSRPQNYTDIHCLSHDSHLFTAGEAYWHVHTPNSHYISLCCGLQHNNNL